MRVLARHAVHVLAAFGVTLLGMLLDKRQPVTLGLVISLLPAAAVATLRGLEARRSTAKSGDERQQASGAARPG